MINQNISHYRVTGRLGSGGMGVVYEAEDLTLGRKVALKFLPPDLARDQNALDRFLLEARTASGLNHPNICTIYAVETAPAPDGAEQSFIAMELLEGQNLSEKLASGPLTIERILDISIQLSDALDAAHSKGIIHRDIKPANIFMTLRGPVKVLDFGLAKLARTDLQMSTIGATKDMPAHLTSPGATVGTISYMSPEQARGEELDTRSDLFALGTVIYQMATGKLPFSGATSAVVFHAILELDPVPPGQLNASLPPKLQEIVQKLLEKDRDLRYQSAADLRGDLRRLKRDVESGRRNESPSSASSVLSAPKAAVPPSSSSAVVFAVRQHRAGAGIGLLIGVVILAAASYGIYALLHKNSPLPFENFSVTKVTDSGMAALVAISPDGKYILTEMRENGLASLQLRNVPTNSVTQVQPPADVQYNGLRFAPDGNYFYFVRSDPGNDELRFLYRAPVLGGTPEKLAEDVDSNVTLAPDGNKAAFLRFDNPNPGEYRLIVKDLQTGAEKVLVSGPRKQELSFPAWSPDGKVIVCYTVQPEGALTGLDIVDPQSGQRKPFVRAQSILSRPEWLPDGSGLLALNMDGSTKWKRFQIVRISYPTGTVTPLTRDTGEYTSVSAARSAPVFAAVSSEEHWDLLVMSNSGEAKTLSKAEESLYPSWTPAGKLITDKEYHFTTIDPDTGAQSALGVDSGLPQFQPHPCADGRIVFVSYEPATNQISVWSMDAAGQNRKKLTSGLLDYYPQCSPDSHSVYYRDETSDLLMRVPIDGGIPQKISDFQVPAQYDLSADGKIFLISTISHSEGHKEKLLEISADDGRVKREIPMQKTHSGLIRYSSDGKSIDYPVRENGVDNLWRQPLDGSPGKWITEFKSDHIAQFRWAPDGKRLVLVHGHTDADVVLIRDQPK